MENTLYYGDNLDILKRYIPDECIDLVYLDPPFKSNQNYNILFKEKNGSQAASQIRAFEDTWTWSQDDESVYADLVTKGGKVADCLQAFRTFLGPCDMLAYLVMMAPRLVELRRVMKSTGSIYLHCDPAASHYLKMMMDATFDVSFFINEITWKRTNVHSHAAQGTKHFSRVQDTLLLYGKSSERVWHQLYLPHDEEKAARSYRYVEEETRRNYSLGDLTATDGDAKGNPTFEFMGVTRYWRWNKEKMERLLREGRVVQSAPGAVPRQKRYLDESPGVEVTSIWTDLSPISAQAAERLGYPTQKPEALLERILKASSNEGDLVLDPFCGCGTTIAVAQKLGRRWIGIDITYLAITLMKKRLLDAFGTEAKFNVMGEPTSLPDAAALAESDPYQFQWWALGLLGARPVEQKKGADKGIDGKIIFQCGPGADFETVIISVKAGAIHRAHVHELRGVVERENAAIGILISMREPTKQMKEESVTAGFYESESWYIGKHPKIQLLSIADLLAGKKISMPPIRQVGATFKKAVRHKGPEGEQLEMGEMRAERVKKN